MRSLSVVGYLFHLLKQSLWIALATLAVVCAVVLDLAF